MKKRLSLITALALAATLSVGAVVPQSELPTLSAIQKTNGRVALNKEANKLSLNSLIAKNNGKNLAKRNGSSITDLDDNTTATATVITEAPKGETVQYSRSSYSFYYSWLGLGVEQVEGNITDVVFGEDGAVYIKNPIAEYSTDSYIKGTLKDDVITVELPQAVLDYDGEIYYADLQKIVIDWSASSVTYEPAENQTLKFSYKDGVITQLDGEDIYLSLADEEGSWTGYGDTDIVLTPFKDESIKTVDLPGKEYVFTYGDGEGHFVTIAKDESNVYIKGAIEDTNSWIKGSISGDKVSFEAQPLGALGSSAAYLIPTKVATVTEYYEGYGEYSYTVYVPIDKIEFTYDSSADKYVSSEEYALTAYGTLTTDTLEYTLASYENPAFVTQGDVSNAVPATPEIRAFYDYFESYGKSFVYYIIPKTSVDGDFLDTNKLFYNIFFDGEVVTFDTELYDVEEEITDIPYAYESTYDFYGAGTGKSLTIYSQGFENIGVQTIYRPEEGKEIRSALFEYNIETEETFIDGESTTGVSNIAADKAVKSEVYYDLTGRRVVNPENGLYIKKVTYEDNTVKVSKIAK